MNSRSAVRSRRPVGGAFLAATAVALAAVPLVIAAASPAAGLPPSAVDSSEALGRDFGVTTAPPVEEEGAPPGPSLLPARPAPPYIALGFENAPGPLNAHYLAAAEDVETLLQHLADDHKTPSGVQVFDAYGRLLSINTSGAEVTPNAPVRGDWVAEAVRTTLNAAGRRLVARGCPAEQVSPIFSLPDGLGPAESIARALTALAEFPEEDPPPSHPPYSPLYPYLFAISPDHDAGWLHNLWHEITGTS